jgi:MoaA/NifB/PqqE/SkfB family radical SAM enzyme
MKDIKDGPETKNSLEKFDRLYNHLKAKAWEKGIPVLGSLELTPRCTLDCKMCYVCLEPSRMDQDELTVRQWIGLIDEACGAGMMFATLTGGECLLYPGFKEIYRHLQSRGVLVTVLTNGTLIDEDIVRWFVQNPPQRIQISVYGSSPKGYEAVTGNGNAFSQVDKAIDLLKAANLPLILAVTASRQMMSDFEATLRYCNRKAASPCRVNPCPFQARRETQRNFDEYAPTLDEQVQIFKIQKKLLYEVVQQDECEEIFVGKRKAAGIPR